MALLISGVLFTHTQPPADGFLRTATTDPADPDRPYVRMRSFVALLQEQPAGIGHKGTISVEGDEEKEDVFSCERTERGMWIQAWHHNEMETYRVAYGFAIRKDGIWEGHWEGDGARGGARCVVTEVGDDFCQPPQEWLDTLRPKSA